MNLRFAEQVRRANFEKSISVEVTLDDVLETCTLVGNVLLEGGFLLGSGLINASWYSTMFIGDITKWIINSYNLSRSK